MIEKSIFKNPYQKTSTALRISTSCLKHKEREIKMKTIPPTVTFQEQEHLVYKDTGDLG